ncbi:MAG: PAS domain S-box protein [Thermodesulfovibrionia bacterium]|nr:PAS domain S-box protein [Thermodesulfovibrionia bacterium]
MNKNDKCKLLADVVLQSRDAITVQDLEGRIIAWNKGAEKIYGYSEAEALKMNISSIIPEDKKQEAVELVAQVKKGKEVEFIQTRRLTADGRIIGIWLTFNRLLDEAGNITGLAAIERDVTEHNRLLEEIETSFALAEEYTIDIEPLVAERTASLIALNIADRIINPAVVISMISRRMLDGDRLDEVERANIETICEESEKLQQIIREFSDIIKKKDSLFSYEDMNAIVKEAMDLIRKQADRKEIELIADLSQKPLMINMHRHVLKTAVFYIYKNAVEATPHGGSITTSTTKNSDSISIIISDTGCGIAEENISYVFDNFFTTKVNGVGMGLPFVKHIISEHFGDIKIESRKGAGTTCTMRFPVSWLKLSQGQLTWKRTMLPAIRETHEYPLQVDTRSPGSGKDKQD